MDANLEMVRRLSLLENRKIKKVCEPAFAAFDLDFFYFNLLTPNGKLISLGTHEGWMEHYFGTPLFKDNPYFRLPQDLDEGLYLFQDAPPKNIEETCQTAEKIFKIKPSFAIFRQSPLGMAQFDMSVANKSSGIAQALNELPLLHRFFDHFEKELAKLIEYGQEWSIDVVKTKGEVPILSSRLPAQKKAEFANELNLIDPRILSEKFTPREKDCIHLLLQDLTRKEIAAELDLSNRTVEIYIENIRKKLHSYCPGEFKRTLRLLKELEVC